MKQLQLSWEDDKVAVIIVLFHSYCHHFHPYVLLFFLLFKEPTPQAPVTPHVLQVLQHICL